MDKTAECECPNFFLTVFSCGFIWLVTTTNPLRSHCERQLNSGLAWGSRTHDFIKNYGISDGISTLNAISASVRFGGACPQAEHSTIMHSPSVLLVGKLGVAVVRPSLGYGHLHAAIGAALPFSLLICWFGQYSEWPGCSLAYPRNTLAAPSLHPFPSPAADDACQGRGGGGGGGAFPRGPFF